VKIIRPLSRFELLKTKQFWLICGIVFFNLAPGWGLVSVYADMFQKISGANHETATNYTTIANASYTIGRLLWGVISDTIGNKRCYYIFLVFQSLLFALLPTVAKFNFGLFLTFVCIICTLYGGAKVLLAPTIFEYLHPENSNTAVGMSLLSISAAALVGPNSVSLLTSINSADSSTSYTWFFYGMSMMTSTGLACILPLRPLSSSDLSDDHQVDLNAFAIDDRLDDIGADDEQDDEDEQMEKHDSKGEQLQVDHDNSLHNNNNSDHEDKVTSMGQQVEMAQKNTEHLDPLDEL